MATQQTSLEFSRNAARAQADADLQSALEKLQRDTRLARPVVTGRLPEFEALRDRAVAIKNHTLAHLDHYLEQFETNVTEAGGHVHWCNDAGDAREVGGDGVDVVHVHGQGVVGLLADLERRAGRRWAQDRVARLERGIEIACDESAGA